LIPTHLLTSEAFKSGRGYYRISLQTLLVHSTLSLDYLGFHHGHSFQRTISLSGRSLRLWPMTWDHRLKSVPLAWNWQPATIESTFGSSSQTNEVKPQHYKRPTLLWADGMRVLLLSNRPSTERTLLC